MKQKTNKFFNFLKKLISSISSFLLGVFAIFSSFFSICFVFGVISVLLGLDVPTSDIVPKNEFSIIMVNGYFVFFIIMLIGGVGFMLKSIYSELKSMWDNS